MKRVGFIFKIKPELKDEYKKAHDKIWPDMAQALRNHGMNNYSIYFRKDGTLFAYVEVNGNFEEVMTRLSKTEINKKWQEYMEKFFIKEDKSTLGPEIEILEEVFQLD